ncbi:hypothetical protein K3Z80_23720, partial [Pseudomonas aeruginosa]|nr:hypothetical protein [Pseudomonas aeruginosa]
SLLGDPSIFREEYLQKTWPFRSAETRVFRGFQTDNEKLAESLPKASEKPCRVAPGNAAPAIVATGTGKGNGGRPLRTVLIATSFFNERTARPMSIPRPRHFR